MFLYLLGIQDAVTKRLDEMFFSHGIEKVVKMSVFRNNIYVWEDRKTKILTGKGVYLFDTYIPILENPVNQIAVQYKDYKVLAKYDREILSTEEFKVYLSRSPEIRFWAGWIILQEDKRLGILFDCLNDATVRVVLHTFKDCDLKGIENGENNEMALMNIILGGLRKL
jgi:hypothetical protein